MIPTIAIRQERNPFPVRRWQRLRIRDSPIRYAPELFFLFVIDRFRRPGRRIRNVNRIRLELVRLPIEHQMTGIEPCQPAVFSDAPNCDGLAAAADFRNINLAAHVLGNLVDQLRAGVRRRFVMRNHFRASRVCYRRSVGRPHDAVNADVVVRHLRLRAVGQTSHDQIAAASPAALRAESGDRAAAHKGDARAVRRRRDAEFRARSGPHSGRRPPVMPTFQRSPS